MRKRTSVVRRAHPDVSNEVAFVALAQSRGRSSEAAAVLHLPRAKDEAALVAMMLDVAAFVALAREMAEARRRSRQVENHRRMMVAAAAAAAAKDPSPHRNSPKGERSHHPSEQEREREREQEQQQQRRRRRQRHHGHEPAAGRIVEGIPDNDEGRYRHHRQHHHHHRQQYHPQPFAEGSGGSRGELRSRRSDSAPSLLPSIEGRLTEGTPPSPGSLRAVLSTSTSVAVGVPRGFGLIPEAARAPPEGDERFRALDPKSNRRYTSSRYVDTHINYMRSPFR